MGIEIYLKKEVPKIKPSPSYQQKYVLQHAINKNYLPKTATYKDITTEVLENMIVNNDFFLYNEDGTIDMRFNGEAYKRHTYNSLKDYEVA